MDLKIWFFKSAVPEFESRAARGGEKRDEGENRREWMRDIRARRVVSRETVARRRVRRDGATIPRERAVGGGEGRRLTTASLARR